MESLPSKDQLYGFWKAGVAKAKQYAYNLSPMELLVENATSNDAWGPTGTEMSEITEEAFDVQKYKEIMGVIARRLQDTGEDWRHVYKSLLLLEFMTKHGPHKVVDELSGNMGVLTRLQDFAYKDKNGKDWGLNVRHRAKELAALVSDPERVRVERNKAKVTKEKYTGVSSDDWRSGGGSKKVGFGSTSALGSAGSADRSSPDRSSSRLADALGSKARIGSESPSFPSVNDAVAETQKRIAALREGGTAQEGSSSQVSPSKPSLQPEGPKGPKKLSEVRVDPSIAAQFGSMPLPKPAPPVAQTAPAAASQPAAQPSSGVELLGGHIMPPNAAPTSRAQPDLWGSFDEPAAGGVTADSRGFSSADPFAATFGEMAGGTGAAGGQQPAATGQSASAADPFAVLAAPAPSAPADPFADALQPPNPPPVPAHQGSGFSKPADPPNKDPFASIAATPSAGPSTAMAASPRLGGGLHPGLAASRGAPSSPLKQGSGQSGSPAGRLGQALPEDLFGQPAGLSGSPLAPRAQQQQSFGQPSQAQGLQSLGYGLPPQPQQQFQQQQQQSQPSWSAAQRPPGSPAFGGFARAPQGMPGGPPSGSPAGGPPGSRAPFGQAQNGFSSWQGAQEPSTGHSQDDFGPTQHFAAPPQPAKKDPFAGLTGF